MIKPLKRSIVDLPTLGVLLNIAFNRIIIMGERSIAITEQSRTPRRASGIFVPPLASAVTSRRLPRLLAKRRRDDPESSTCTEGKILKNSQPPVSDGTVDTPVLRLALRRRMREIGNNPESTRVYYTRVYY